MQLPIAPSCSTILDAAPAKGRARSVYMHVPFCFHKCHYCDFYSLADEDDSRHEAFVARLLAEVGATSEWLGSVETVFVGGGTPSLLRPELWKRILREVGQAWSIGPSYEFTIEANPETVTEALAQTLIEGGVNRVSVGCQSFDPRHLKTLERWHEPSSVVRSVNVLRSAGLTNLNLDLIFGIPGQTLDEWRDDLRRAIDLGPTHVSCYGLTYEPNTPLYVRMKAGKIEPVEEDTEAAMYEATMEALAAAGYEQYEISNWSRPGLMCRHNLAYWRNQDWWALGPSASGHVDGLRWKNVPRISDYLERAPWPAVTDVERADESGRIGERFMVGLRLNEGMRQEDVDGMLSHSASAGRREALAGFVASGLLERTTTHLRLTHRGRLLANEVVAALI
jgi:oxygen-independent coproporphyrinogen III oxidase